MSDETPPGVPTALGDFGTDSEPDQTNAPSSAGGASAIKQPAQTGQQTPDDLSEADLRSLLTACGDALGYAIESSRYRDYLIPLVFYKSVTDTGEPEFTIPAEARWETVLDSDNPAKALDDALVALETSNEQTPFKTDVIVRFADSASFTQNPDRLRAVLEELDDHDLHRDHLPDDPLGTAFTILADEYASGGSEKAGQYFTPPSLARLLTRLLDVDDGMTVHDPTCGGGGLLTRVADVAENLVLTGQELNPRVATITQMGLTLRGATGDIRSGNSLAHPQFTESGGLETFDRLIANPPFSADWKKDELSDDTYERFDWHDKRPRKDRADYAFLMHIVAQLNDDGRAAVVVPQGMLFRKHEGRYREFLVENDLVTGIVSLDEGLFQNTDVPVAVLVLDADKPPAKQGQVEFVHGANDSFYNENDDRRQLTDDAIDVFADAVASNRTESRLARPVDVSEIEENDYNFNVALYVDTTEPEEDIDVEEVWAEYQEVREQTKEAEEQLDEAMAELGYTGEEASEPSE